MGWCDSYQKSFIFIPQDWPYHGKYSIYINMVLNGIRFKDYIQKYYYILKDGSLVPKFPRGAVPKIWS